MPDELTPRASAAARVERRPQGWRLALGADTGAYQLAQLDDYSKLTRRKFPHRPPFKLSLRARASHTQLAGTWGFGLWNDPFGFSLGLGGAAGRLPALPNAAWFFFASPQNYLAFREGVPGNGQLAAVYSAPHMPALALAPAALALPLAALPATANWLRLLAGRVVQQQALQLPLDPTEWHSYEINWRSDAVEFSVDGEPALRSELAPRPPLGLVLWLDNQYAAWRAGSRPRSGVESPVPDSWIEFESIRVH